MNAPKDLDPEELLNRLPNEDVLTVFGTASRAEDDGRLSTGSDKQLIDVYDACLHQGLTYSRAPDTFLDACRRLSKLLFRYGRPREANNYLLQDFTELADEEDVPTWAWCFSAKLEFLKDQNFAIQHPKSVLNPLSHALSKDKTNRQSLAILQEFLRIAKDEFRLCPSPVLATGMVEEVEKFLDLHPSARTNAIGAILRDLEFLADELEVIPDIEEKPDLTGSVASTIVAADLRPDREETSPPTFAPSPDIQQVRIEELATLLADKDLVIDRLSSELDALASELARADSRISELKKSIPDHEIGTGKLIELPPATPETIDGSVLPPRSRILVIGDSRVQEQRLAGICKQLHIDKNQVQFALDYNAFDKIPLSSLQYNGSVAGILIGPVPHKVPGCDDPANTLITSIGYPPTVKIESTNGELKITKSSFREALNRLLVRIATL